MRIIHIVENLDKGAVENWIVNIFLESKKCRPDWHWSFYCILGREGKLDKIVRDAGGEIIYAPVWITEKLKFLKHLRGALKAGNYDILHVHHDYLSGFYLLATIGLRFEKRILQVHNTDKSVPVGSPRVRKILLNPLRVLAIRLSDIVVGISKDTLSEFLQGAKLKNKKSEVLYYGIDLCKFKSNDKQKGWLKKELEIPDNAKIILFAGRMNELKNPVFVVEILSVLNKMNKDVYSLFIGKGGEEEAVLRKGKECGLTANIRLAGWRDDVADIMKEADVFVFPRVEYPREGLGLVVVEAQSAGLPMALSRGIVEDAIIIRSLAHFIPLQDNPAAWADVISGILKDGKPLSSEKALDEMEHSCFALPNATKNFIGLYEESHAPI